MDYVKEIEKIRKQKGYKTKAEFAKALGYSERHYMNVTSGCKIIGDATLQRWLKNAKNIKNSY